MVPSESQKFTYVIDRTELYLEPQDVRVSDLARLRFLEYQKVVRIYIEMKTFFDI